MKVAPRTLRAKFLVDHLDLAKATGVDEAEWEPFQLAHLNDDGGFRIENKSRQIAWSFVIAAEAVVLALLDDPVSASSVFISVNQAEAVQKINYARAVYESLAIGKGYPTLTKDTTTTLEWGGGIDRGGASIESLPAKDPRGKARRNFYGDEFAHVQHDRSIYKAAVPITSKGGRFRLGSSPMGASGVFWEVFTQEMQPYPDYTRKTTPWWQVMSFCTDVVAACSRPDGPGTPSVAERLSTSDRVERFGRERIKVIYRNMVLEDFQQEYEALFVDEATAWLTWEEIKTNTDDELLCASATARPGNLGAVMSAIDQLDEWRRYGTVEKAFYGGVDIGRTRNTTEIGLVGTTTTKTHPLRLHLSLDGLEFPDQEAVLHAVMRKLPVVGMQIDMTGLGMQLAQGMEKKYPSKVQGMTFTNDLKKLWATNVKMLFQQRRAPIPSDRELAYQLHAIKRLVTPSKSLVFDNDRNEKHHCYNKRMQILTEQGWKSVAEVTLDDKVSQLEDGRLIFERPLERQEFDYSGPMVRVKNKQVDLFVTPNHRMYVAGRGAEFDFEVAKNLLKHPGKAWRYKKDAVWVGEDTPQVPLGTPEQYAELLGYYLSEGCKASQYRVIFYQNAGPVADRMMALLGEMGKKNVTVTPTPNGALRIEVYWKAIHNALPTGKAREKYIPREVMGWSPRLLRILLAAMMDGDGTIGRQGEGQWAYYSTSRVLADNLTELLLRVGWCGTVKAHIQSKDSFAINPLWRVNINRTRLTPVTNKRTPSHSLVPKNDGNKVYCLTTRTHLLYVRGESGASCWCGNSDMFWMLALALSGALEPKSGKSTAIFQQRKGDL